MSSILMIHRTFINWQEIFSSVSARFCGTACSPRIGAYLWICIENLKSLLIVGATASGKTTTLGALAMFMKPELKIVTIEELREIKLPHENWIPMVTRESNQEGVAELGLFDLLKSALRQRPDYIIVGEIRGRGILYSIPGHFNWTRRYFHDPRRQRPDRDKENAPPNRWTFQECFSPS